MQLKIRWFLLFILCFWQINTYAVDETPILMLEELDDQRHTLQGFPISKVRREKNIQVQVNLRVFI